MVYNLKSENLNQSSERAIAEVTTQNGQTDYIEIDGPYGRIDCRADSTQQIFFTMSDLEDPTLIPVEDWDEWQSGYISPSHSWAKILNETGSPVKTFVKGVAHG